MLRSLFLHRIALLALALFARPSAPHGAQLNCSHETLIDDRTLRHAPAGSLLSYPPDWRRRRDGDRGFGSSLLSL